MEDENKIDFLNPGTIMFFIMGALSDFVFLGLIGLLIPGVGLVIAMFVLGAHYFFGLIILAFFWGKTKGWLPKAILLLVWVLPLPLLAIGIILAVIGSNKLGALIIETVAIQTIAVATGGAGEALEGAAIAGEGVEAAAGAAEAAGVIGEGAEAVGGIAEAGGGAASATAEAEGATAAGAESGEATDVMADANERDPMDRLKDELEEPKENDDFGKQESEPEEEPDKEKTKKHVKKMFDIADRFNKQDEDEEDQNEDDDSLPKAA